MAKIDEAALAMAVAEHYAPACKIEQYPSKVSDFKNQDIVHCSLLTGIYKVMNIDSKKVYITHINNFGELLPVSPKFLKKLPLSNKAIKVLFGT